MYFTVKYSIILTRRQCQQGNTRNALYIITIPKKILRTFVQVSNLMNTGLTIILIMKEKNRKNNKNDSFNYLTNVFSRIIYFLFVIILYGLMVDAPAHVIRLPSCAQFKRCK